jgi:hypothetical protein
MRINALGIYRRGAIFWWRKRLVVAGCRIVTAISLRTEDRNVARGRAMLVIEEATRLADQVCSHAVFGDTLRAFLQALETDHRTRLMNDLETGSARNADGRQIVLAERAMQNEMHAALYWIAHRCGPGAEARWEALAPRLKGWELHNPEQAPIRDKILQRIEHGFIAECFKAGSTISGTPTEETIRETLAHTGQPDTPGNRRVLFGEFALTQTFALLEAARVAHEMHPCRSPVCRPAADP